MRNPARSRFLASLVMAAFFLAPLGGCTRARVDAAGVQAEPYAPEAAEVPLVRVPYDPRFPRFVVAVEPFALQADSAVAGPPVQSIVYGPGSWGVLPHGPRPIGWTPPRQQLSAHVGESVQTQLVSALSNVGNLIVIDYDYYWQNRDRIDRLVGKGEAGPYLLRGAVTEFNEISESDESGTGSSLGLIGVALGIAGAIAGNSPAAYTGLGLAVANPGYQESVARRTGQVGVDLNIVDARNGRIVGTAVANGSFTSENATSGFSLFGFGSASTAVAESALAQATRAAMNSATVQIVDRLKERTG
ncbi:MAG: CsgG/HfaB family protein [Candidatus Binatia bacterium]|nr:CsgG/HfaB family protein [Candidatus Binatia bacterium]